MSTKHIISPQKNLPMNAKVCALIDEDGLRWITKRVTQEFFPREAQQILGIPLSLNRVPDLLIWAGTKSGRYMTKSAYKMLTSKLDLSTPSPSNTQTQTSCWRRIWSLSVPNKIKHFLWRACRDSLPTKKNLLAKNVTRNALCEWCNGEVEDSVHALWGCQVLKEVWWEEEILRNHLSMRFVDFRDPWIGITSLEEPNLAERFAFVAWSIWNKRNATRMHASSLPFHLLYQDMQERLLEYRLAQEPPIPKFRPTGATRWYPPQISQHKVNYDGTLFKEIWQAGVGVVVRDADGRVCGALSDRTILLGTMEEVEAIACREAVRFALQLGLADMVFEGDSKSYHKCYQLGLSLLQLFWSYSG